MVTCNEKFVGVWVGVEPGESMVELVICTRLGKIACVDENVAVWERRLSVVSVVCVGYADEADAWRARRERAWRQKGRANV